MRSASLTQASPCGWSGDPLAIHKVMVIWEENHSYSQVIGSSGAPEINRLASECALATDYRALTHPSLPNYMEMTSASPYDRSPWNTDCSPSPSCSTKVASIFSAVVAAGRQWRSYAESMPKPCDKVTAGYYAARHNPAVYYDTLATQCEQWDVPMGTTSSGKLHTALVSGGLQALTTLTPNVEHDMHNGTVAQADSWLASWMPQILGSPDYRSGRLAVVIVWDEGAGSGNVSSRTPLIVLSGSTPRGVRYSSPLDDYSIAGAILGIVGARAIGSAQTAPSMISGLHL